MLLACNLIDPGNQRIIVEHKRHLVRRNLHKLWRDGQRQVQNMGVRDNIPWPIGPDCRSDMKVAQFNFGHSCHRHIISMQDHILRC